MLGRAIATRPLARDGLAQLTSDFGRTRLAEAAVPSWGRTEAKRVEKEGGARAARTDMAAASRP
jgi:hypothetical protein